MADATDGEEAAEKYEAVEVEETAGPTAGAEVRAVESKYSGTEEAETEDVRADETLVPRNAMRRSQYKRMGFSNWGVPKRYGVIQLLC